MLSMAKISSIPESGSLGRHSARTSSRAIAQSSSHPPLNRADKTAWHRAARMNSVFFCDIFFTLANFPKPLYQGNGHAQNHHAGDRH